MSEPTQHLRLERPAEGVAMLVLDNPDQRNAMSDPMTAAWTEAIDELAADRSLRVVIVTGEGSAFCSGGNTSWIASEPDASVDHLRTRMMAFYRAWLSIRKLEVPTIAAVNGPAIGAGLCLALACDIRYGAASARLGAPFVKLGM
ncbi:enoyl-CoA hydratase/isomerase family protein, partial [Nocardioides sp.]|uniref:enoyl-CoA hydratase/isomerase family protein n=1 Tax=Nocardioides sp. TaxID=35761 RepID=UPI0031FE6D48